MIRDSILIFTLVFMGYCVHAIPNGVWGFCLLTAQQLTTNRDSIYMTTTSDCSTVRGQQMSGWTCAFSVMGSAIVVAAAATFIGSAAGRTSMMGGLSYYPILLLTTMVIYLALYITIKH